MSGVCCKILLVSLLITLITIGMAQAVVGFIKMSQCEAEPSLPIWMVIAGFTMVVMAIVSGIYAFCSWCNCVRSCHEPGNKSPTVFAVLVACMCGCMGVVLVLVWLGLWIAGSYFVINAVKEMRIEALGRDYKDKTCDLTSVLVSGSVILCVWLLFIAVITWLTLRLIQVMSKKVTNGSNRNPAASKVVTLGSIYDSVPREENAS